MFKAHLHAKNKEEASQSDFCERVRNWTKNRCNLSVRRTGQMTRRIGEARHTRRNHAVHFWMGTVHWKGAAHWASWAGHTVQKPEIAKLFSKSPWKRTEFLDRISITALHLDLCYDTVIDEWWWYKLIIKIHHVKTLT